MVLINGDFQAVRNHQDLQCMAVPDKYKQLGTFYKYVDTSYRFVNNLIVASGIILDKWRLQC